MRTDAQFATRVGDWVMVVASLAGLAVAIFDYVAPGNSITGSGGAMLVVVSSALLLAASLIMALALIGWRWPRVAIDVLLCLGIIGTGLAAYMLEADLLLATMAVAFVGWVAHVIGVMRTVDPSASMRPSVA